MTNIVKEVFSKAQFSETAKAITDRGVEKLVASKSICDKLFDRAV